MASVLSPPDLDGLVERGILNLAGCALARLDGKSTIDYLTDFARRDVVREMCRRVFKTPLKRWSDFRSLGREMLSKLAAGR
jgi:hypothetical protein